VDGAVCGQSLDLLVFCCSAAGYKRTAVKAALSAPPPLFQPSLFREVVAI
jgi:hypothetical protein